MKILVINGSPRKNGNTEILVNSMIEGARGSGAEIEVIRLAEYAIQPCVGCGGCDKTDRCVIEDDMQKLYDLIDGADRLVIASPIYFYNVTAQTKAFIDRCQAMWSRKYLLGKHHGGDEPRKGYFVSVCATRGERIFDGAILTVKYALDAMDFAYDGALLVKGVDRKGAMAEKPEELERAREFGRRIASN
ncbi:MAG TPA: flavodoxin family protein [Desulfobacteraceae bacterium]|nr:flavodoxin family protein [Desulfobacteraceae bacterium]